MVQVRSGALEARAIVPFPPAALMEAVCGLKVIHPPDAPAWVMIAKALPTVILPQRGAISGFGATVKLTLPLPDCAAAGVRVIQGTEAALFQEQVAVAATETVPVPPAALSDCGLPAALGHTGGAEYATVTFSPVAVAEFTVMLRLP